VSSWIPDKTYLAVAAFDHAPAGKTSQQSVFENAHNMGK
jgi:hypothetical protein